MSIGIIGAGELGCSLGRYLWRAGYQVVIATGDGKPQTPALDAEKGLTVGTAAEAAETDVVLLTRPITACSDLYPAAAGNDLAVADKRDAQGQRILFMIGSDVGLKRTLSGLIDGLGFAIRDLGACIEEHDHVRAAA
jgi:3-hydroxyisobutyrate dehydrogenase-like beta-hydroxyacid dehydrogenase